MFFFFFSWYNAIFMFFTYMMNNGTYRPYFCLLMKRALVLDFIHLLTLGHRVCIFRISNAWEKFLMLYRDNKISVWRARLVSISIGTIGEHKWMDIGHRVRIFRISNYNIGPLSLSCVCNWSLKFEASTIGRSSFKIELY